MHRIYWPCRVTARDRRYRVAPLSADACACEGSSLSAAAESAIEALREYASRTLVGGRPVDPPIADLSIEERGEDRILRLEIPAR